MKRLYQTVLMIGVLMLSVFSASSAFDGFAYMTVVDDMYYADTNPMGGLPSLGKFHTFCIENNEYFTPGTRYFYNITSGSTLGGLSGATSIHPYTGKTMDPISIGTAWLYWQYRQGTLPGYAYDDPGLEDSSSGLLQQAIWYLEGETTNPFENSYVKLAKRALGLDTLGIKADSHGAYGVVALNLFDINGGYAQDQLGIMAVPEPATFIAGALLLLPFGLSTVRSCWRQRG